MREEFQWSLIKVMGFLCICSNSAHIKNTLWHVLDRHLSQKSMFLFHFFFFQIYHLNVEPDKAIELKEKLQGSIPHYAFFYVHIFSILKVLISFSEFCTLKKTQAEFEHLQINNN